MLNRNSTLSPRIYILEFLAQIEIWGLSPKSDTCKTCDGLTVKIQSCGPGDANEKKIMKMI